MRRLGSREESGAIAIIVALFAIVIFALAAVVVDLGSARAVRRQAQSTADSAALAGATQMILSANATKAEAVNQVHQYAQQNLSIPSSAWTSCVDSPPAGYTVYNGVTERCISFNDATKVLRVRLPSVSTPTFFAGIAGRHSPDVSALAEATWGRTTRGDCVICVLSDFRSNGRADLDANGFPVAIGGTVTMNGSNTSIDDASVVSAVAGQLGNLKLSPTTTPTNPIDSLPDPLAALALPVPGATVTQTSPNGACAPGAYFEVNNCTSFTANGVYQITRSSSFKGNAAFTTNIDATFYFTCDKKVGSVWFTESCGAASAQDGGAVTVSGNGAINLRGSSSGAYAGLALIFDRALSTDITLNGNGQLVSVNAGIYGRNVDLTVDGGGNSGGIVLNGPSIFHDVRLNGGGAQATVFTACASIPNACGNPFGFAGPPKPPNLVE